MNSGLPQIRLFNTLSKTKENFVPLDDANVRMYVCGPTVYDYAHIGNARPAIVFDVLFRLLRHVYGEKHVTYVRNITDVDDKINARAARDFPDLALNKAIQQLTKTTEKQYQADMKALGCLEPSDQPRATDHIAEMIEMIEVLLEKGHAYVADGHVLFAVNSYRDGDEVLYGRLARRTLDDMIAGARVEVAPYKRDAMDFVLWKPSASNEPGWDSPWGTGRPGWHIECSAMSKKYLGEIFDIHGGGIDLSFPHHENELAQSCCANGKDKMAQIWMHNGFLQIEGNKMSKSEGNFFTVHDLLHTDKFGGRKWPGQVLRLAMLMKNYREPMDFSLARLEEAESILRRWKDAMLGLGLEFVEENRSEYAQFGPCSKMLAALANDMNMSGVLAELHRHAGGKKLHNAKRLFGSLSLLGLVGFDTMRDWQERQESERKNTQAAVGIDATEIGISISQRLKAIAEKDWAEADRIRDELAVKGIKLLDKKDPTTGERITSWEVKQ